MILSLRVIHSKQLRLSHYMIHSDLMKLSDFVIHSDCLELPCILIHSLPAGSRTSSRSRPTDHGQAGDQPSVKVGKE